MKRMCIEFIKHFPLWCLPDINLGVISGLFYLNNKINIITNNINIMKYKDFSLIVIISTPFLPNPH